mmetsp:Transcript_12826/g.28296  ORF Transcript_12826/g.28296 Transcript_12826/m.28296 type:complete len:90 (-) Transcript_12826:1064-1333(-)
MAAALPLTKLAGLFLKTLAKPMAKRIKHEAARTPSTQKLLISIGQMTHNLTSRMTVWSMGYKVKYTEWSVYRLVKRLKSFLQQLYLTSM